MHAGIGAIARASIGSKLRHLEAGSCGITADGAKMLHEALAAGSPLLCLKLQGNSIGEEGADSLGAALAEGAALQELNLGNNQVWIGMHEKASSIIASPQFELDIICWWNPYEKYQEQLWQA